MSVVSGARDKRSLSAAGVSGCKDVDEPPADRDDDAEEEDASGDGLLMGRRCAAVDELEPDAAAADAAPAGN